jgi:AraC-like DNA-binding protein
MLPRQISENSFAEILVSCYVSTVIMTGNVLHIVSIIAVFQSFLMAVFFAQNKKNARLNNYFLVSLLIVFAVMVTCTLLTSDIFQIGAKDQRVVFLCSQAAFLIGPLFYLYIKSLLNSEFTFRKKDWLHFVPFFAALIVALCFAGTTKQVRIWSYPGRMYVSALLILQSFLYLAASSKDLKLFGLTWRTFLNYIDNSRMEWVRFFTSGYILIWLVQLQLFITWDILKHPGWCPYANSLHLVVAFLFFNGMVIFALLKPETFSQASKYQSSALQNSEKENYRKKLLTLMENEQLYLDSSLSLPDLSTKLGIAPCYVSQIINESFHQNFNDFVNKYRIDKSKELIAKYAQTQNISEIALEAGFNSKSTFNSAFKKHTGITPKEFKKQAPLIAA